VRTALKALLAEPGVRQRGVLPGAVGLLCYALELQIGTTGLGEGISTRTVTLFHDLSDSRVPGFDFSPGIRTGVVDPTLPARTSGGWTC
jgi:hypothetical protein